MQIENSNNIISGILYNQLLIDRDSCSDICSRLFYDVAPGQMYKNRQGKLAKLLLFHQVRSQLYPTYL